MMAVGFSVSGFNDGSLSFGNAEQVTRKIVLRDAARLQFGEQSKGPERARCTERIAETLAPVIFC
jgi:hypothetical protein